MRSRTSIRNEALDGFQRFRNLFIRHSHQFQSIDAARNHRFDAHGIARVDPQDGFDLGVIVAPMHVFRNELQLVCSGLLRKQKDGEKTHRHKGHKDDYLFHNSLLRSGVRSANPPFSGGLWSLDIFPNSWSIAIASIASRIIQLFALSIEKMSET